MNIVTHQKPPSEHPSGQLTLGAHVSQQTLLQPLLGMHYTSREDTTHSGYSRVNVNHADLVLAAFNPYVAAKVLLKYSCTKMFAFQSILHFIAII